MTTQNVTQKFYRMNTEYLLYRIEKGGMSHIEEKTAIEIAHFRFRKDDSYWSYSALKKRFLAFIDGQNKAKHMEFTNERLIKLSIADIQVIIDVATARINEVIYDKVKEYQDWQTTKNICQLELTKRIESVFIMRQQ